MRKLNHILLSFIIVTSLAGCSPRKYDLIVYGGTAAGVMAARGAAEGGLNVLVVEPSARIGGLTTGGLGQTDIGNKQVVKGYALEFYRKLGAHYGNLENWVFEPSAALEVIEEYASHPRIRVLKGYHLADAQKDGARITGISLACGPDTLTFSAPWFIDCSYEGDLMAAAGVEYRVGREDNGEYGETWNGVHMLDRHQFPDGIDPFVEPGNPSSGLVWGVSDQALAAEGSGDRLVQAYNYRICLTDSLQNMVPLPKPEDYDPARYELLARLIAARPEKQKLSDYFIWSRMPGRKTDINNNGGFSTDMIGMNYNYPEASWEERQEIVRAHRDYTLGVNRTNISGYLEHNLLLKNFTLSAGLVAVKNTWSHMNLTVYPGIDLSYRPHQNWKLHASYNTSLRMPSFTEMYYKVQGYSADPHLKPEEMQAIEVGLNYQNRVIYGSLTLWHHHGKNMIDWIMDTSKGDQAMWESVNHTTINSIGLEVSGGIDLRQLLGQNVLRQLKLSYSYIDQDKKQEADIVSQYALEYLRHKLIGNLSLQLAKRLALGVSIRWQDRVGSYTDFDGSVCDYRPYCLTDARLTWQMPTWKLYAEANNLFDTSYHDYGLVEQPGRWLIFGLSLHL